MMFDGMYDLGWLNSIVNCQRHQYFISLWTLHDNGYVSSSGVMLTF
jgi:hypothetical protein